MSWTGGYDRVSFLDPIERYKDALFSKLKNEDTDTDVAEGLIEELDELERFVHAIAKVDGPSDELQPVSGFATHAERRFVLKVGKWRAFFLLDPGSRAYYGAFVDHPSMPLGSRLQELSS